MLNGTLVQVCPKCPEGVFNFKDGIVHLTDKGFVLHVRSRSQEVSAKTFTGSFVFGYIYVAVHVFDQGILGVMQERYHIFSLYRGVFLNGSSNVLVDIVHLLYTSFFSERCLYFSEFLL